MLNIFQIRLSDAEIDQLNREGWESENPKIRAYGKRYIVKPDEVELEHYSKVAIVLSDDLEEAFTAMNLWEDRDKVILMDGPCPSMSVGDLVQTMDGVYYLCASFGFKEVEIS